MRPGAMRVTVACAVLGAAGLRGQAPPTLAERLARLDTGSTDWVLVRDVCDKVAAIGADAVEAVEAAVDAAGDRADRRYAVRLTGVLARLDDRGVARLRDLVAGDDARIAAFAARVLGRCGADTAAARAAWAELLAAEPRPWVGSAIAMGACDAGVTEAADAILTVLRERDLEPDVALWFTYALARLSGDVEAATVTQWLRAPMPLRRAGVLAARWHRAPDHERALIGELVDAEGSYREWVATSLGACGGAAARRALQRSLDEDGDGATADGLLPLQSTRVDARRLALARLGEPAALAWLRGAIEADGRQEVGVPTFEFLSPQTAQVAELYGKWRCAGAAELLHGRLREQAGYATSRAYAARGLCWQRDRRGLDAAAALLVDPAMRRFERGMGMALPLAQRTLHDFVADTDRPDYLVVDDDEELAAAIGAAWQRWLAQKGDAVRWCEPLPDDDFVLWR